MLYPSAVDAGQLMAAKKLLDRNDDYNALEYFLQNAGDGTHLHNAKDTPATLYFFPSVSQKLGNVVVLDASYPIRELERMNSTIQDVVDFSGLRNHETVVVR